MPLLDVPVAPVEAPLPPEIVAFLGEADRRIEAFVEGRLDDPIVGFVPCDFPAVYRVLATTVTSHLAPGKLFCEWGSGFGIVTMLASMLGFDACGIEIEPPLVTAAEELAEAFDLPVEFAAGSFLPYGADALADFDNEFTWLRTDGTSGYDDLGLDPHDFDVVFAYPWPGEERVVLDLFERYASTGALLVTYQGVEDVRVHRKTAR